MYHFVLPLKNIEITIFNLSFSGTADVFLSYIVDCQGVAQLGGPYPGFA